MHPRHFKECSLSIEMILVRSHLEVVWPHFIAACTPVRPGPHWGTNFSTNVLLKYKLYKLSKQALSTTSENFKKHIELYYHCVKQLGRFGLSGTSQGIVCIVRIDLLLLLISGRLRTGSAMLHLWLKTTTHSVFANGINVSVHLHIDWRSEIHSQVVTGDTCGDSF